MVEVISGRLAVSDARVQKLTQETMLLRTQQLISAGQICATPSPPAASLPPRPPEHPSSGSASSQLLGRQICFGQGVSSAAPAAPSSRFCTHPRSDQLGFPHGAWEEAGRGNEALTDLPDSPVPVLPCGNAVPEDASELVDTAAHILRSQDALHAAAERLANDNKELREYVRALLPVALKGEAKAAAADDKENSERRRESADREAIMQEYEMALGECRELNSKVGECPALLDISLAKPALPVFMGFAPPSRLLSLPPCVPHRGEHRSRSETRRLPGWHERRRRRKRPWLPLSGSVS